MELAFRTPLVESFRQGGVPRDVRLLAAGGGLAPTVPEQLQLLMLLVSDPDREVAIAARSTVARLPDGPLDAFLSSPDVPGDVREFFANRAIWADAPLAEPAEAADPEPPTAGRQPGNAPAAEPAPPEAQADPVAAAEATPVVVDAALAPVAAEPVPPSPELPAGDTPADIEADPERRGAAQRLAALNVAERMKVAMQGTREERSILIRDPNRLVSSSVLSSPKLTESEVEAIARMTNVADEVLRTVGTSRQWTKSYSVIAALTRNPKTPVGVALTLLPRLSERDVKMLSTDRNIPEPVRLAARKLYVARQSRKE